MENRSYQKIRNLSALLTATLLLASSCVQFKPMALYDAEEPEALPVRPVKISQAVEPVVFDDSDSYVWGFTEDPDCLTGGRTTEAAYSGEASLLVNWDRNAPGCDWVGFGIGWDNWAGKDLSEILPYAAIEMHVRAVEGKMFGLPIVLTLEDYSGGQSYSYTGNKYFERSLIDEQWQRVVVPLATFNIEKDGLDATNVKQLMMELQQSGRVYLDDIRLIFYEPEPQKPWLVEEPLPDPLALPIQLFGDAFLNNNGWGLIADECQDFGITSAEHAEGSRALHLSWQVQDDCQLVALGGSWNKWHPVDVRPILPAAAITFELKTAAGSAERLPIRVGLQDYGRTKASVLLEAKYVQGGQYTTSWRQVSVPLADLEGAADFSNIRDLVLEMEGKGDVFVDNIRLEWIRE